MRVLTSYVENKALLVCVSGGGGGGGGGVIHGTKRRRGKALTSPVQYPCRECKHVLKESKRNMFNPIFKENVQGWKHLGSCAFAEPELLM